MEIKTNEKEEKEIMRRMIIFASITIIIEIIVSLCKNIRNI